MRRVVIYPGQDSYWVAGCPSLPGCVSQGRTRAEAVANIREAIGAYVAALQDDSLPVPLEDLHHVAAVAQRGDEEVITLEELQGQLKEDGLL